MCEKNHYMKNTILTIKYQYFRTQIIRRIGTCVARLLLDVDGSGPTILTLFR